MPLCSPWDEALVRRYDLAGPRYTSYPTAARFDARIGPTDFVAALQARAAAGRPLSVYVHVPFCANVCYYCACNKVITRDRRRADTYLAQLSQEVALVARHLDKRPSIEQLHLGGGTPTFLSTDQLHALMAQLTRHFRLQPDDCGDYSIEIDPRETNRQTLPTLRALGFNRLSIGVQDFDPQVQRAVNRVQPRELTEAVMADARALGFGSISFDLIYGLPEQTPASFSATLEVVLALRPDRLSLFNYAHLPARFNPRRRIDATRLPAPAVKLQILQSSFGQLIDAGYRHIGMDHFALPHDRLAMAQDCGALSRNFQGYTTHGHCDLLGLGASAISQFGDLYCQNSAELDAYQAAVSAGRPATVRGLKRTRDDALRAALIEQLACGYPVDFERFGCAQGIDFRAYFADAWPALERMASDGLVRLDVKRLALTPAGRLLARAVCMVFDRHLTAELPEAPRYSRVI